MTRRLGILWVTLLAILAVPREGSAGIGDFIWELSGPQMVGVGISCRWTDNSKHPDVPERQCGVGGGVTAKIVSKLIRAQKKLPYPFFFALGGALYGGTGLRQPDKYKAGRNGMFAVESSVDVHSHTFGNGAKMYQSLGGVTLNLMFGKDHKPFLKTGIKLTPIEIEYKNGWGWNVNVRLYPDGFTDDQFNVGPRTHGKDRPSEFTYGFGITKVVYSSPKKP